MAKAVIVMDMPESCMECRFRVNKVDIKCGANYGRYVRAEKEERPDWCPLQMLPERKFIRDYPDGYKMNMKQTVEKCAYEGYNRCLDDILGGSDG